MKYLRNLQTLALTAGLSAATLTPNVSYSQSGGATDTMPIVEIGDLLPADTSKRGYAYPMIRLQGGDARAATSRDLTFLINGGHNNSDLVCPTILKSNGTYIQREPVEGFIRYSTRDGSIFDCATLLCAYKPRSGAATTYATDRTSRDDDDTDARPERVSRQANAGRRSQTGIRGN